MTIDAEGRPPGSLAGPLRTRRQVRGARRRTRRGHRHTGLRQAGPAGHRLDGCPGPGDRPPHTGAAGEGRVLGCGDQARAGHGLPGFPVFTRKAATDLSYLVCARRILAHPGEIAGQFATHNAHTVAAVMALAGASRNFEFQRLHGMGESLYRAGSEAVRTLRRYAFTRPSAPMKICSRTWFGACWKTAPNTSFVNRVLNERLPPNVLLWILSVRFAAPSGRASRYLSSQRTVRSEAGEFVRRRPDRSRPCRQIAAPLHSVAEFAPPAASILFGHPGGGAGRAVFNPANHDERLGHCADADQAEIRRAFELASEAQPEGRPRAEKGEPGCWKPWPTSSRTNANG